MNELIREIEEDIQRERMQKLWNGFGKIMVAISVLIVLATVVVVMWQGHRQSVETEHTSQFIKGLDRLNIEDYQGAIKVFDELAADDKSPYYGLSMLRKAQAEELLNNKEEALTTYQTLAKHENNEDNKAAAGLARILAAHASGALIEPSKTSPFYDSQNEWRAWQLVAAGKKDDAAAIFLSLRHDIDAPATMRARATEALQQIAADKLAADNAALVKAIPHE